MIVIAVLMGIYALAHIWELLDALYRAMTRPCRPQDQWGCDDQSSPSSPSEPRSPRMHYSSRR